jgi:hypothetical protein
MNSRLRAVLVVLLVWAGDLSTRRLVPLQSKEKKDDESAGDRDAPDG